MQQQNVMLTCGNAGNESKAKAFLDECGERRKSFMDTMKSRGALCAARMVRSLVGGIELRGEDVDVVDSPAVLTE